MEVKVNTTITLNDLELEKNELNNVKEKPKTSSEPAKLGIRSTTERATIKVDNHVRNMLTALVNVGMYDSQKDAVEKMCYSIIDNLSEDEKRRFDFILDSLELKDYNKQQRKK